ncbi:MAG: aromatic ring-hydroxylating dioxygenase subunit alpha, partial [Pseudomonadota bacterium]
MLDGKSSTKAAMPEMELPITDRPDDSFTLPASWYIDPEVYEREKEAIFYRTWQYVGHKAFFDNPGDYMTVQICDQNVFVIRGGDGVLRAFYNVCRHRAHELLPGPGGNVKSVIVCPYHAWTFAREGGLRGARFSANRPGFNRADYSLREVRLEEFANCIFVNLDDDAESMADTMGEVERDIRSRLTFLDELAPMGIETDLLGDTVQKAGWKVVVDNYVECYHCQHAHPDFSSIICMD